MKLDARTYLTLEELARVSGLSVVTLRRYWHDGKIVGFQPGGPRSRVLFPRDALERKPAPPPELAPPTPPSSDAEPADREPTQSRRRPRAQWRKHLPINQP